jgi:hypothetical protein
VAADVSPRPLRCKKNAPTDVGGYRVVKQAVSAWPAESNHIVSNINCPHSPEQFIL